MEEAKITRKTRLDRRDSFVVYPHPRGELHVAKADGSETLVVDRVRLIPRKGGAKCKSLAEFDGLEQHRERWPNGYGLALSLSSYRALRKECLGDAAPAFEAPSEAASEPESEG